MISGKTHNWGRTTMKALSPPPLAPCHSDLCGEPKRSSSNSLPVIIPTDMHHTKVRPPMQAATPRGVVSSSQAQFLTSSGGTAVAIPAAATAIAHRGCFSWAMLSPGLVMIGVLVHAVLEGLAIGLQVRLALLCTRVLTASYVCGVHYYHITEQVGVT